MNKEHYEILKSGVAQWNAWREENPAIAPDLSGANLTDANLTDANLIEANLRGANLSNANLFVANLYMANLTDANLRNANLTNAILVRANLQWSKLTGADLSNTALNEADLTGANLIDADLTGADLTSAKFADIKGIFQTSFDQRGWTLISWRDRDTGAIGFTAGCRSFESSELAKDHWGGGKYPNRRRGEMYCECIDFHLKQWDMIKKFGYDPRF